jgi:hypothetical protein
MARREIVNDFRSKLLLRGSTGIAGQKENVMRGKRNADTEFHCSLGKVMERRRLAEGLSREQMLRLMDDHHSTSLLCCYEGGSKPVTLRFMMKWCDAMGMDLPQLLKTVDRDMAGTLETSMSMSTGRELKKNLHLDAGIPLNRDE